MWEDILMGVVDVLLPAVLALLGALIAFGAAYLKHKTEAIKNEELRQVAKDAIDKANQEIYFAVEYVAQTYVSDLKEAHADGKLTPEEKAEALAKAKAAFKMRLGEAGLRQLAEIVGDLDEWIRTQIEAAVFELGKVS